MRVKRSILFSVVAILISLAVSLFVLEAVARVVLPKSVQTDPVLKVKGTPTGDRDANGFRNQTIPEKVDIVVLGDSQTEGNNATREEAWPHIFAGVTGYTVYQMAVGGYSAPQYRALIQRALLFEPRVVIVALYTGNDLLETSDLVYSLDAWSGYRSPDFLSSDASNQSKDIRIALDAGVLPGSFAHNILSFRTYLRSNVRVYALFGDVTRGVREALGLAETRSQKDERLTEFLGEHSSIGVIVEDDSIRTVLSPSYRFKTVDLSNAEAAEGWRLTKILLAEARDEVEASGALFAVVTIPTKEMVYLSSVPEKFNTRAFAQYQIAEESLLADVADFCEKESITCIHTLSALSRSLSEGKVLYGKTLDGHPVAEGYRVIAAEVARIIPSVLGEE